MTDDDQAWLREGIERAEAWGHVALPLGRSWEYWAYYYLVGWLVYETKPRPTHDGGGIF